MSQLKHFVIRELGATDATPYAVVSHGEAFVGNNKRKVLFVHRWHAKEETARAEAHAVEFPDYG